MGSPFFIFALHIKKLVQREEMSLSCLSSFFPMDLDLQALCSVIMLHGQIKCYGKETVNRTGKKATKSKCL